MATVENWEKHFQTLSHDRRKELRAALLTLRSDEMFGRCFNDSGLFSLVYSLEFVDPEFRKEALKKEGVL